MSIRYERDASKRKGKVGVNYWECKECGTYQFTKKKCCEYHDCGSVKFHIRRFKKHGL